MMFYSMRDGYEDMIYMDLNGFDKNSFFECNTYYIGEFKDGLRNGKGILFYPNKKIKLAGNWINDQFDFW